jgi:2-dehydropantoate 2-reductase
VIHDVVAFNRQGAKTHSGYWRDLSARKRNTEVTSQLQPVIDIGRNHGIDCRALRTLLGLVIDIENGRRTQSDALLLELASPIA